MKSSVKRILSIALAIALIFSLSASVLAADSSEQPFSYYMCIGDSIGNKRAGDMSGFYRDGQGWLLNSYPQLVSEYYGLTDNKTQRFYGAHAGWRTSEVISLIDDSYAADPYHTDEAWLWEWGGYSLKYMSELEKPYRAALSRADLITVNLGSNDIMGMFYFAIYEALYAHTAGTDMDRQFRQALEESKQANSEEAIVTLIDFMLTLQDYALIVPQIAKRMVESLTQFGNNWDHLIKCMQGYMKDDAVLVVIGMYNPLGTVAATNLGISDTAAKVIKTLTDPTCNLMNAYMQYGSKYASDYEYVDISDVDLTGTGEGTHLGQVGHRYFADKIIKAANSTLPCNHDYATELINYRAASKLLCGYSGDVKCSHCGAVIEKGHLLAPTLFR